MSTNNLYTPTYTLKPFGENIWIVDGEIISFYGLPFTTRMTVVKLPSGDLWIHSPIDLTNELKKELDNLGPVKYLISPNKIHYWYLDEFQKNYPKAITFASDGVQKRSQRAGISIFCIKNRLVQKKLYDMPSKLVGKIIK
jgi:hypothetical protein